MMTEKEAWLVIAAEFEKPDNTSYNNSGICHALDILCKSDQISHDTDDIMYNKIRAYRISIGRRNSLYLYHYDDPKAKSKRATLCREFASKL